MKKNKYLIIDSNNILIKLYGISLNSSEIFKNNNVSEENRKIILKICNNKFFSVGDAIELLTEIPFDITETTIKKENDKIIITATDKNNLNIFIENELSECSNKEVIEFYNKLKKTNELENYIKSINTLFKYNIKNYEKRLIKIK